MNFRARLPSSSPLYFHVTPFVDILLVLLAFFVLTWSIRTTEADIKVALPEAKNAQPETQAASRVIVNIREDGSVTVNQRTLSDEELHTLLEALAGSNARQLVVIRADEATDYRNVLRVLDICRGSKIVNIGFAASPPTE